MQVSDTEWSEAEKQIAQEVFQLAYEREIKGLIKKVRAAASDISERDDLWHLHDFLSARRHEIEGKYDYRDSAFIFVFAELIKQGWLRIDELDGINQNKLTKVAALARM